MDMDMGGDFRGGGGWVKVEEVSEGIEVVE